MEEVMKREVGTSAVKEEAKSPSKMSYEQLENIAHQLSEQSQVLARKLQEANMTNAFKRLDYLFKVVENKEVFNSSFLADCLIEIESSISIPEDKEQEGQI